MRNIKLFLFALLLASCAVTRHKDTHRKVTREKGVRIMRLEKDSVVYQPRIIYKDTTIVVQNRHVQLRTQYAGGRLIRVVCEQKPQETRETYEREIKETDRQKDVRREGFRWDDKYIFWFFGFVLLLVIVSKLINKL